jgi:integrase
MRPGEVCGMRWADIDKKPLAGDTTGSWLYVVPTGKTAHHGHVTRYVLPPAAQRILEQFPATPLAFIFSPAAAMAERRKRLRKARQTKVPAFQQQRDADALHEYADRWGLNEYRHAVERACVAAKVARFTPHELRHGFVTWAANALSLSAAAAAANHRNLTTTQGYVHVRHDDAIAVAAAVEARARG